MAQKKKRKKKKNFFLSTKPLAKDLGQQEQRDFFNWAPRIELHYTLSAYNFRLMQKFCHLFLGGKAGLASEGTSDGVISFRNCINSAERVPTYVSRQSKFPSDSHSILIIHGRIVLSSRNHCSPVACIHIFDTLRTIV